MRIAGLLHRRVERDRVGIVLGAAPVQHRREVGAAAEPRLGGHHEARVHVHRRHVRVVQVRDQRNARRPEARVGVGARDVLAEFGRELAKHGRDVDADLLEHAPLHHRHDPAAAGSALADPAFELPISGKPEIGWPRRGRCGSRACAQSGRRGARQTAPAGKASSSASNAAQISSRRRSNQARARALRASIRPAQSVATCHRCLTTP